MYTPSMPEIGRLLAASTAEVQLTLSAYLMGFAIGQVVYGPISDRWGRKPVLLMALALFCLSSLACAAAPTIETLIAARALQALGGAGAIVLPRAVVRDLYAGKHAGRELSRIGAVMSFAPAIAPLIGGIVQTAWGWRANFVVVGAVAVLASIIAWQAMPETLHREAQPTRVAGMLTSYNRLVRNRAFLAHLGLAALSYAGLFAWISGSPFVLQDLYGLSPFGFGVAFAAACIGSILGAMAAAALVLHLGLDRTIGLGALALALGGLSMVAGLALGLSPVASLVICMLVYHAGLMLVLPQAIAGAMTPFPDCAGTASSLVGFVQQTSAALLGIIVGRSLGHTAWPLAISIAMMGCLSLALWAGSRRMRTAKLRTRRNAQAAALPDRAGLRSASPSHQLP
jgi:DHA1 family bicyclomycin/chloramphenicol resistance-like MFS transporter